MKKLLLSLGILSSMTIFAQQNIKIIVRDAETQKPVINAVVSFNDGKITRFSDENGVVLFNNLENTQNGQIQTFGYEPLIIDEKSLTSQNELVFNLSKKAFSIDEVVIASASKNSIYKAISNVDVQLRPINNSQEVLRLVPGLFIGQHAGGGKAEQLFLRGFDIDHGTDVALSADGMPVNMVSHAHGQGYADLHFIIPEFVSQVNFNKGPYFANKGNFNTAGFVDFETANHLDNNFVKGEIGQFNSYRSVIGLNLLPKKYANQNLILGGEYNFSQNYFENPQNFKRYNGFLKYHGKISNNTFLTVGLSGFSSSWNASGQIPERAVNDGSIGWFGAIDPNEGGKTSRYNANVNFKTYADNGAKWNTRFYFTKYDFELYSNFTFFLNDPINGDQIRQKESRFLYGTNVDYEKNYSFLGMPTEFMAGIGFRHDETDGSELSRTRDRVITTEQLKYGNIFETNISGYISQRMNVSPKFTIAPGARVDYFHNKYEDLLNHQTNQLNSAIVSPKLNFEYQMNPNVKLYSYWGKGFHSNDTRVAVTRTAGRQVLPAAYGSDLGGVFKIGNKFLLQTALWYLWLNQEFVYVGDEAVVEESGKTQRYGIDVMARYEILKHLFLDVNLNYANPRNINPEEGKKFIPLAPTFTSIGGLTYRREQGFNANISYRYMGDRPATDDGSITAKGYLVWDATAKYNFKRFELGVMVQNLFNTKWKETQFETETRLRNETEPVSEIHFTAGTPFFARTFVTYKF